MKQIKDKCKSYSIAKEIALTKNHDCIIEIIDDCGLTDYASCFSRFLPKYIGKFEIERVTFLTGEKEHEFVSCL